MRSRPLALRQVAADNPRMADDIIRDFVRQVWKLYPDTRDDDLLELELALRRTWGGSEVYVCKKASAAREKSSR